MENPIVSFIITYYNEPIEMLTECLDSILALSLSDSEREIILVDDGSEADTIALLHAYRDSIIYLRQPNRGLSCARNIGIETASGRYIQFVDADDYLIRTPYEHCLDIVRYHAPDMVMFRQASDEHQETPFELPTPVSGAHYMRHNNLRASAWGYLFRRSLLHGLRFLPTLLHEDEDFTPRLLLKCDKVFDTNDCCYFYRKRQGSITQNTDMKHRLHRLNDKETIIHSLVRTKDVISADGQTALQRRIDQLTMDYLCDTITLTHSIKELNSRIKRLEDEGLFPLPEKSYTKSYAIFRRLIKSHIGRRLLMFKLAHKG